MQERVKGRWPVAIVILLSGHDDFEYVQKAIELGISRYVTKPVDYVQFKETIRKA